MEVFMQRNLVFGVLTCVLMTAMAVRMQVVSRQVV
jgi:hypothetical protein